MKPVSQLRRSAIDCRFGCEFFDLRRSGQFLNCPYHIVPVSILHFLVSVVRSLRRWGQAHAKVRQVLHSKQGHWLRLLVRVLPKPAQPGNTALRIRRTRPRLRILTEFTSSHPAEKRLDYYLTAFRPRLRALGWLGSRRGASIHRTAPGVLQPAWVGHPSITLQPLLSRLGLGR